MFIQTYHQEGTLITEQQVNVHNPLFELANLRPTRQTQNSWAPHNTHPGPNLIQI